MTGLAAVIAAASRTGTADAESRAVSLNVTETLAVVALLGLGAARKRAFARLVVCRSRLEQRYKAANQGRRNILGCLPVSLC